MGPTHGHGSYLQCHLEHPNKSSRPFEVTCLMFGPRRACRRKDDNLISGWAFWLHLMNHLMNLEKVFTSNNGELHRIASLGHSLAGFQVFFRYMVIGLYVPGHEASW